MGREPPNLIPRQLVKLFLRFEPTNGLKLKPFGLQVPCRGWFANATIPGPRTVPESLRRFELPGDANPQPKFVPRK